MTALPHQGRRGLLLVISSPSGAGKTSLSRRLVADHADLDLSISATTRSPRPGEQDGREYHFVGRERFDAMVADQQFLAWAEGQDVLFDIDWQGAMSIAASAPGDTVRVFILPPSMTDLRRRLYARAQDDPDVIERRLGRAKGEIRMWGEYDYVIVNEDFDRAYAELAHIYHAERLKRARNGWLGAFVGRLMDEEA